MIYNKKIHDAYKTQLVIAINLIHLSKNNFITFYVKSKNVNCTPADNSIDIFNELTDSLLKYYNEKLTIARTDSSYIFYSVNELNTHFHKVNLSRTDTYTESPKWLYDKKSNY